MVTFKIAVRSRAEKSAIEQFMMLLLLRKCERTGEGCCIEVKAASHVTRLQGRFPSALRAGTIAIWVSTYRATIARDEHTHYPHCLT
jgi:hypothetical protein